MNQSNLPSQQMTNPANDTAIQQPICVEIYVADHCQVCDYAYQVADAIRSEFPEIDLEIINITHTTREIPDVVFATPTYLIDGRLWSLGNPSPEDVQSRLSQRSARRST